MVCLEPLTPDEFAHWYRHLARLRLFWAKPVVELFPLYRLVEGCVVKVRWSSEKPRLEEAYLIILRRAKKLDFAPFQFSAGRGGLSASAHMSRRRGAGRWGHLAPSSSA